MDQSDPPIRPYFLPGTIDFAALPQAMRLALTEIVEPAYRDLVLGAQTSLERAAGTTLVFLLCQEVLEQCAIGEQMDLAQRHDPEQLAQREKLLSAHYRLLASKQQTANFLLRSKTLRERLASRHFG